MYWIGHKFLSFPTILTEASQEREIDNAYRMRALLYMILILGEFSHSAAGACILLQRLQEYVGKIPDAKVHAYCFSGYLLLELLCQIRGRNVNGLCRI